MIKINKLIICKTSKCPYSCRKNKEFCDLCIARTARNLVICVTCLEWSENVICRSCNKSFVCPLCQYHFTGNSSDYQYSHCQKCKINCGYYPSDIDNTHKLLIASYFDNNLVDHLLSTVKYSKDTR